MIYDSAVIGTGPAGLSAALNLKIHDKNFLWFGSKSLSEKIRKAEQILNYPGMNFKAHRLPATDDILERAVNISVGVVDKGLGSKYGININSTDEEIAEVAKTIRDTIESL